MISHERILAALSIITAFGACAATIYLVTYWSTFGIDVMQFIGLADIVKLGIYPILIGSSSIIGGYVLGTFFGIARTPRSERRKDVTISPASKRTQAIADWLEKYATPGRVLVGLFILVVVAFIYSRDPWLWIVIVSILGFAVASKIEESPNIRQLLPDGQMRNLFVFVPALLLTLSFGVAKHDALRLQQGKGIRRVSTKMLKDFGSETYKARGLLETDETLKFIGVAGDYFFFLREDNTATYAFKYDDLVFFETWR